MASILITAFEPYGSWKENSSWLALVELTRDLPEDPKVVTRRYPVDFSTTRERLAEDENPVGERRTPGLEGKRASP